jgi:hypothetical protein
MAQFFLVFFSFRKIHKAIGSELKIIADGFLFLCKKNPGNLGSDT